MHSGCYLRDTNACSSKISGEHLLSEGVLKVLAEKQVEITGLPWLKGEKKILGFAALTSNILCRAHNSALSPIDAIGARFFSAIQSCGTTTEGLNLAFLFSGHDIERWLLRTVAALAVSKNFAIDCAQLDDTLGRRLRLSELLEILQRGRPLSDFITWMALAIGSGRNVISNYSHCWCVEATTLSGCRWTFRE